MKTKLLILMACLLPGLLQAQNQQKKEKENPDEQITVNKEYDENGNLIRYDSVYTYEWHGDTMMVFPNGSGAFFDEDFFSGFDNLHHFFSDSAFNSPFNGDWNADMFKRHEEFLNNFANPFFDQDFLNGFSMPFDSLNNFQWNDSSFIHPFMFDQYGFPDLSEFFENMDRFNNQENNSFDNEEQQKEWEEIMKRYQEEMDQFNKKWDTKKKQKPDSDIKQQRL